jgi:adenosylmethionine-8-amino-7-oxononanoate aminotransferase
MTIQEKDKAFIWHPFTQMKTAMEPIHIERAEGCMLYASDGRKFIDAVSSWWVNIHGHSNPFIAEAIARQAREMEHVIFAGFTHTPAILLAEKLIEILPDNFAKVFFSDDGSTSVEVALKMALQYWFNKGIPKTRVIAFDNAYHGDTFGAMSVGARSIFNAPFHELLFDVEHIPVPIGNDIEESINRFTAFAKEGNVAAFIYEPLIQGAAGMVMYEARHLERLLTIAKANNILCIADEVMTGFGRTGKLFASDYLIQKPDIICLSKGITGGFLPLGITVCTQEIFDAFYSDEKSKALFHGHSYTANPIACAAANASLELLLHPNCTEQIKMISTNHESFINKIKSHSFVRNACHTGTIIAIEFNTKEDSSYFNSITNDIYKYALDCGVLLRPLGNIIYFMPPYCIVHEELHTVYDVMEGVIENFKESNLL